MMEIEQLCDEILKRAYAMLHQSPATCPETAEEMLTNIYMYAQEIKKKEGARGWGLKLEKTARSTQRQS
jgi:hypothetical protein